jgi:hypothetical protein
MIVKKFLSLTVVALLISLSTVLWAGGIDDIDHPNWSGNYLVDRTGTHRGAINSSGELSVRVDSVGHFSVAHISSILHVAGQGSSGAVKTEEHKTGALTTWRVSSCGTTVATAVTTNTTRRDLIVNNIGDRPVYIGYGATGHVALTIANGFPMHSMGFTSANGIAGENHRYSGPLTLANYQGPLSCIAPAATGLSIIEILK